MILRRLSNEVIAELAREVDAGNRRVIVVAPTGAGKTVIAAETSRTPFFAARLFCFWRIAARSSADYRSCTAHGIAHGIIQAGFPTRPAELVQVASVQP